MKYLKSFNESISIYDKSWEKLLPKEITVMKGEVDGVKEHIFKKGNIMLNPDMVQITYTNPEVGIPETLEIDIYFHKESETQLIKLDIDITWGDEVASEFTIDSKNKLEVVQYTSYHSKFDPSNTVFAFDTESLKQFVEFLNRFKIGTKLTIDDFKFLDKNDNYNP